MSAADRFVKHFYSNFPGRVPLSVAFGMGLREILPFVFVDATGEAVGIIALGVVNSDDARPDVVQIFHMSAFVSRRGDGTRMLRALCATADRFGVTLTGTPMFISNGEDPRMSDEALASWYRRHGFQGETFLHRHPSA